MATVIAHTTQALTLEKIIGLQVRYQKHRPGAFLSVEEMPKVPFQLSQYTNLESTWSLMTD
ncbi:hypothetical protein ACLMAB_22185 [Brevibacillus laterosporus]